MDSSNRASSPRSQPSPPSSRTPDGPQRSWSSDSSSTVYGSDAEKKDLESQSIRTIDRSFSHYLGVPTPVTANLDDIDEEFPESENGDVPTAAKPSYQRIDDHPNGYPRLAALLNSDENFLICRKYGFLHNRVLLYRQDELRELEEQLLRMDKVAEKQDDGTLACRARGERCSGERRDLINRIDDKLREYNDIVQRTRAFASLQKATERNHKSVCNWLNHAAPLVKEEAETFDKDRDFVALVDAKEGSWFDGAVETALSRFGGKFIRVFLVSLSALLHPSDPF